MRLHRPLIALVVSALVVLPALSARAADSQKDPLVNGREFSNPPRVEAAAPAPTAAPRDNTGSRLDSGGTPQAVQYFVHPEDVSIQGSNCVGLDCTSAEAFGFDTIRLKENNLRIMFQDTSTPGGGFPYKAWQLRANESTTGGLNLFSIDNITDGKSPLVLLDSARNNAIYAQGNNVGFGTNTPQRALDAVEGDTPTLRLDQQGGPYPAYVWDVSGNETNFFIAHYQGGQRLVFRIFASPPQNSMVIAASGDIGLGTQSPSAQLHLSGTSPTIRATNTSSGTTTLDLDASGNMTLSGLLLESSSREVKDNLVPVDDDAVLSQVAKLPVYRWNYKTQSPATTHMGPVAEDFAATFGLGHDNKHISAIDLSGVTLSAVQALERQNREKDAKIADLQSEISRLSDQVKALAERVDAK